MKSEKTLKFNPLVETQEFDNNHDYDTILCEVPTKDGNIRRYTIPSFLLEVLKKFDGSRNIDDVKKYVVNSKDYSKSWDKIEKLIYNYFIPSKILVEMDDKSLKAEDRKRRGEYMQFRVKLVAPKMLNFVGGKMSILFDKYVSTLTISFVAITSFVFYARILPKHELKISALNGQNLAFLTLLIFLGAVIHELGHATAAISYDCRDITIGWGWYLHLFVLYTDLSEVWRLRRKQRAVVDLGGIYFQSLYLSLLLCLYGVYNNLILLYCFLFSSYRILGSLNPFIRLDGYWLLSDIGGTANLRQKSVKVLTGVWNYFWNGKAGSFLENISKPRLTLIFTYTSLCLPFFAYLTVIVFQYVVLDLFQKYPSNVIDTWRSLHYYYLGVESSSIFEISMSIVEILWKGTILFFILRLVYKGLKKVFSYLPYNYVSRIETW